jgi:hypothetical protein
MLQVAGWLALVKLELPAAHTNTSVFGGGF